ncbi:MAG: leucine-rich repeat domain-containing protein [Lachnospiraceae bacterium]
MRIKEADTPQGVLQYRLIDNQAEIIAYRGKDLEVVIPDQMEDCPVTCIGKKAFLSNKMLKRITLPASIMRIDDWAFACCAKLTKIVLPYHKLEIGQGAFKECYRLEQIIDEQGDMTGKKTIDVGYLLAATMSRLNAFYLFDFENAGTDNWLAQWDARMQNLMELDDADGFSRMLLCGEEDYGSKENNLEYYMSQQRRGKVRLAMLRLMHDYGLPEATRAYLKDYLLKHIKGQATEETWLVVLEEHGDEREYYRFLTELGCVTTENFQSMMEDMGDNHTEMKAYLMRYHGEQNTKEDAFDAFVL